MQSRFKGRSASILASPSCRILMANVTNCHIFRLQLQPYLACQITATFTLPILRPIAQFLLRGLLVLLRQTDRLSNKLIIITKVRRGVTSGHGARCRQIRTVSGLTDDPAPHHPTCVPTGWLFMADDWLTTTHPSRLSIEL